MGVKKETSGGHHVPEVTDTPPAPPPYPPQQPYFVQQYPEAQYNMYPYPPAMYVLPPPPLELSTKPAPAPHSHIDPSPAAAVGGRNSTFEVLRDASPTLYFLIGLVSPFFLGPFCLILLCCPPFEGGANPRAVKWFLAGFVTAFVIGALLGIMYVLVFVSASKVAVGPTSDSQQ